MDDFLPFTDEDFDEGFEERGRKRRVTHSREDASNDVDSRQHHRSRGRYVEIATTKSAPVTQHVFTYTGQQLAQIDDIMMKQDLTRGLDVTDVNRVLRNNHKFPRLPTADLKAHLRNLGWQQRWCRIKDPWQPPGAMDDRTRQTLSLVCKEHGPVSLDAWRRAQLEA